MLPFAAQELISLIIILLSLILISAILRENRAAGTTLSWIQLLVTLPVLGIILYFMFGARKLKNKNLKKHFFSKKQKQLRSRSKATGLQGILAFSGTPYLKSNVSLQLLKNGEEAFLKTIDLIQNAKKSVYITTFIIGHDPVGHAILAALAERAQAGVDVRIIVDSLSTLLFRQPSLSKLKTSGGQVAFFMPMFQFPFRGKSNMRNHRKLITVDGSSSILGGMNLTQSSMGILVNETAWADLALLVQGPSVLDLQTLFLNDWTYTNGDRETTTIQEPELKEQSWGKMAQVIPSGPDVPGDPLYDILLSSIHTAQHEIQIVTPYFIPDELLSKALELAAKRGVRVKILIPRKSNHFLADLARGSFIRQLRSSGVHFDYFNKMIHAKAVIFDHSFCLLGSANFDMRSLLLNYEVGILIYDDFIIKTVKQWALDRQANSTQEYVKDTFGHQLAEGIGRILGPFI